MTLPWEKYKGLLIQLYKDHTLDGVKEHMEARYQFRANRRTYHKKFAEWGIGKRPNDKTRTCIIGNGSQVQPGEDQDEADGLDYDELAIDFASASLGSHARPGETDENQYDGYSGTANVAQQHGGHGQRAYHQGYHQSSTGGGGDAVMFSDFQNFNHQNVSYVQEHQRSDVVRERGQNQFYLSSPDAGPYDQAAYGWGAPVYATANQFGQGVPGSLPPPSRILPSQGALEAEQMSGYPFTDAQSSGAEDPHQSY